MKLLCTGFHPAAAGEGKRTIDYVTHFDWLRSILADMGIELEWREVVVGEELRGRYDGVVVSAVKVIALPALNYRYGALWALSQLPGVIHYDDWAITQIWQAWKPHYLWRDLGGFSTGTVGKKQRAALPYREQLDAVIERIAAGKIVGTCMAWEWGNHAILRKYLRCPLVTIEPTNYYTPYPRATIALAAEKRREWASASIANIAPWLAKLRLTWPLQHVGKTGKSLKGGRPGERYAKLPEVAVVLNIYRPSWGALAQAYNHAGSGWWRQRYYHAADVGTVTFASPVEMGKLGPVIWGHRLSEIEGLSDAELAALARQQRETLYAQAPSRAQVQARVWELLEKGGVTCPAPSC